MSETFSFGFFPPENIREQDRIPAKDDGKIEVPFLTIPVDRVRPALDFIISQEFGSHIVWIAKSSDPQFFPDKLTRNGKREIILTIFPGELMLAPGTYVLRINADGKEIHNKSLVIEPHPRLGDPPTRELDIEYFQGGVIRGPRGKEGPPGLAWIKEGWTLDNAFYGSQALYHNGSSYRCILNHTSSAENEPGIGGDWENVWQLLARRGENPVGALLAGNNLSELTSFATARGYLSVYSKLEVDNIIENLPPGYTDAQAAWQADIRISAASLLRPVNNLSELTNFELARAHLDVYSRPEIDSMLYTDSKVDARIAAARGFSIASLVSGKVPINQIPDVVVGQVKYQDTFDASTGLDSVGAPIPLPTMNKGAYYICSVAGNFLDIYFDVGDWLISNGIAWQKVDNTDAVTMVAGRTGAITLDANDIAETSSRKWWNETLTRDTKLTGLSIPTPSPVLTTDSVLSAFGKVQSQLNNKAPLSGVHGDNGWNIGSVNISDPGNGGTLLVMSGGGLVTVALGAPTFDDHATTKKYVDDALGGLASNVALALNALEVRVALNDLKVTGADRLKLDGSNAMTGSLTIGQIATAGKWGAQYDINTGAFSMYRNLDGNRMIILDASSNKIQSGSGAFNFLLNQSANTYLYLSTANTIEQRNGLNAQTLNVYNTYTDAANYERGSLLWTVNKFSIRTQNSGIGSVARSLELMSASALFLGSNNGNKWTLQTTGDITPDSDVAYSIGSTTNKLSGIHVNTSQIYNEIWLRNTGGVLARIGTPGSGKIMFRNGSGTGPAFLILGASESNLYPALKANGADLHLKLGDDSGFASVFAKRFTTAHATLAYATSVAIDFSAETRRTITLTGNVSFTTTGLSDGAEISIRVIGDTVDRNISFPAGWRFVGDRPASLAANKIGQLAATAYGPTDADVVAAFTPEN